MYEILKSVKFDIAELKKEVAYLEENVTPYFNHNEALAGWSIHGSDIFAAFGGDLRKIASDGAHNSTIDWGKAAKSNYMLEMMYVDRTEACVGYINDVLDKMEEIGLPLYRARLLRTAPQCGTAPHFDAPPGTYLVRVQIPIVHPENFTLIFEGTEYTWPSDDAVYAIRTDCDHSTENRSDEWRYSLMGTVFDFNGVTEYFKCSAEDKAKVLYHNSKFVDLIK